MGKLQVLNDEAHGVLILKEDDSRIYVQMVRMSFRFDTLWEAGISSDT